MARCVLRHEVAQQLVAKLLGSARGYTLRRGVSFVDDNEFGAGLDELLAATIRLYEVDGDDCERVFLKDGAVEWQVPPKSWGSGGPNFDSRNVELLAQLGDPLGAKVRRAEYAQATDFATVEKLTADQASFNCLANSDVVGDKESHGILAESHQERHKLTRLRLNRNTTNGPEWTSGGAEPQTNSISEEDCGQTTTGVDGIRKSQAGGGDIVLFEWKIEATSVSLRTTAGTNAEDLRVVRGRTTHSRPRARTMEPTENE